MEEQNLIEIGTRVYTEIPIFGGIPISQTTVSGWIVVVLVLVLCLILTHKMEKIPRKATQILAEKIVITVDNYVGENMGPRYTNFYTPYFMALGISSLFGSLVSLVGLKSITGDINTVLPWAVITFFMIRITGLRARGPIGEFKELCSPSPVMFPMNVLSMFAPVISLTFRHFGNVLAGGILMGLIYSGLGNLTKAVFGGLEIPILQVGIPAVASLYFDLFSGAIQAFIFCTLSMVFVAQAGPGEDGPVVGV